MKVKQVMHEGTVSVAPSTGIKAVAKAMRDNDIGVVPVSLDGHLIGVVTDRDITCRGLAGNTKIESLEARDVMSKDVVFCADDDDIEDAVHIMEDRHIRRLPVVDSKQHLIGMLSLGDISHGVKPRLSAEVLRAVSEHHA